MIGENRALLESGELLNETEKQIFSLLKRAGEAQDPVVVCRVAGGWVRDKLLGKGSDDLDFAIENMSGRDFATRLMEFEKVKLHVNPEQSQHLDSAKVGVYGTAIDMCQLRCDEYSEGSRIPTIRIGTLMEDTLRRDFTMNSMYYNVNTGKVEDLTTGFDDLVNGMVRTPRDAFVSFNEDPLRIFRAVRFATRFNFSVDDAIMKAAAATRDLIPEKVTRPRMEQEISKILSGPDPLRAVQLFVECGLFGVVFDPTCEWNLDVTEVLNRVGVACDAGRNAEKKYPLVLAAIYTPIYQREPVPDPVQRKKMISCLEYAIVRLMCASSDVAKVANKVLLSATIVKRLFEGGSITRVTVGKWLREVGPDWVWTGCVLYEPELQRFYFEVLQPFVASERLDGVWNMKPLVNGKELAAAHGVKPGPVVTKLLEELIEWQIEHPDGTFEAYMEQKKSS